MDGLSVASFWIGFATACGCWVAFGLGIGAISVKVSVSKDGVEVARGDD